MTETVHLLGIIKSGIASKPTRTGSLLTYWMMAVTSGAQRNWWSCSTFSDTVRAELEGLTEGDSLSVVGEFSLEIWEKEGRHGINRRVAVSRALALRPEPKTPAARNAAHAPVARPSGREVARRSWAAPANMEGGR
jgi:single-stranded DNA-binding protein